MTYYNTGNPVPSANPKDFYDNAQTMDRVVNQNINSTTTRTQKHIYTFAGMEYAFNQFLLQNGYVDLGNYQAGLVIDFRNKIFVKDGSYFRIRANVTLPYITTGNWASESANFLALSDQTLRSDLLLPSGSLLVSGGTAVHCDSVSDMVLKNFEVGQVIITQGYYNRGDGGGGIYRINTGTGDGYVNINLNNGRLATLMHNGQMNIKQAGARGNDIADDTLSFQKAILQYASGLNSIFIPQGTYKITSPLIIQRRGIIFYGSGLGATLKCGDTFTGGTALLTIGYKASEQIVSNVVVNDFDIDCNSVTGIRALEIYGVRDGSVFKNIRTNNTTNSAIVTNCANNPTGNTNNLHCRGITFINVNVFSFLAHNSSNFWQLDGIYDSQLIGCKAVGSGVLNATLTKGFNIGTISACRGISLISCSVESIRGGASNYGIHYSQWAISCWDQFTTFVNIQGSAVLYDGAVNLDSILPYDCNTIAPRLQMLADEPTLLNPAFLFVTANSCSVQGVNYYSSNKTHVQFNTSANQQNNYANIYLATNPNNIEGNQVVFQSGSSPFNYVDGVSTSGGVNRRFLLTNNNLSGDWHTNGFSIENNDTTTEFRLAHNNRIRFRNHENSLTGGMSIDLQGGINRLAFYGHTPITKQVITGSRAGNPALTGLLNALAALGLIENQTSATAEDPIDGVINTNFDNEIMVVNTETVVPPPSDPVLNSENT